MGIACGSGSGGSRSVVHSNALGHAAIDIDDRALEIGYAFGQKKRNDVGDILRRAEPVDAHLL